MARVCRSQVTAGKQETAGADARVHQLTSVEAESEEEVPILCLEESQAAPISGCHSKCYASDDGVGYWSGEPQQHEIFSEAQLQPSQIVLLTYTAESVAIVGVLPVKVAYKGEEYELSPVIVRGNEPALFGRDWLSKIHLDWHSIMFHTLLSPELERLLQKYEVVFGEELATIGTPPVHLSKENCKPKFVPAHSVPFAIKDAIAQDIERLQFLGIIEKGNSVVGPCP